MLDIRDRVESVLDNYKCPSCYGHLYLKCAIHQILSAESPVFLALKDVLEAVAKEFSVEVMQVERNLRNLVVKWMPELAMFDIFKAKPTVKQLIVGFYELVKEEETLTKPNEDEDLRFSVYPRVYGTKLSHAPV